MDFAREALNAPQNRHKYTDLQLQLLNDYATNPEIVKEKKHPTLPVICTVDGRVLKHAGTGETLFQFGGQKKKKVRVDGEVKNAHWLVYETFLGDSPNYKGLIHLDGNLHNNAVWNLVPPMPAQISLLVCSALKRKRKQEIERMDVKKRISDPMGEDYSYYGTHGEQYFLISEKNTIKKMLAIYHLRIGGTGPKQGIYIGSWNSNVSLADGITLTKDLWTLLTQNSERIEAAALAGLKTDVLIMENKQNRKTIKVITGSCEESVHLVETDKENIVKKVVFSTEEFQKLRSFESAVTFCISLF